MNMESCPGLVKMEGITKRFPGTLALDGVDIDLCPGEVHVLVGENGAGKSTIIKILTGYHFPTEGNIYVKEELVTITNPHIAHRLGICAVYQEFSLVSQLSIAENIFLGDEPMRGIFIDKKEMVQRAGKLLELMGLDINPSKRIRHLTLAERQVVEIAKAIAHEADVFIFDEPTASLTSTEANKLFEIIDKLKTAGKGIIYISHRLEEVQEIGSRVTVLREGRKVATLGVKGADESTLIKLMTGKEEKERFPRVNSRIGRVVLSAKDVWVQGSLKSVSFLVREGEIFGFAGLIGSGKEEIAKVLYGLVKTDSGEIEMFGERLPRMSPAEMIKRGVMYIPADRRSMGLVLCRSITENITLPSLDLFERFGLISLTREEKAAGDCVKRMDIRTSNIAKATRFLSGGNQQKVVLSRGLLRDTKLFIFEEPTRGVDIGARIEVYAFIHELAKNGAAIVLISSDLPEILNLCHNFIVLRNFECSGRFQKEEASFETVLESFFMVNPASLDSI
jgi:ribose transport system ATP-binding protein